jgi:hypothetical protein
MALQMGKQGSSSISRLLQVARNVLLQRQHSRNPLRQVSPRDPSKQVLPPNSAKLLQLLRWVFTESVGGA